jgi:hypothetical protein
MRIHEESAQRHEVAAALWDTRHDAKRAEFERRCARIEREAAQLDADRSELARLRANWRAQTDAGGPTENDHLTGEIERRSSHLQAATAALEQERVRLWPHHGRQERERSARGPKAPSSPEAVASEPEPRGPGAVDKPLGAATPVSAQARENARHLSSILSHTAKVLETSAALAQANAERLEQLGRADAGAEERRAAERACESARRARLHAKHWLEFALGRPH